MKEPTKAQVKEFWEGYGFEKKCLEPTNIEHSRWGWFKGELELDELPPIDLNNLFKYAVPKVAEKDMFLGWVMGVPESSDGKLQHRFSIDFTTGEDNAVETIGTDPALALFWALWEVKEKSNG